MNPPSRTKASMSRGRPRSIASPVIRRTAIAASSASEMFSVTRMALIVGLSPAWAPAARAPRSPPTTRAGQRREGDDSRHAARKPFDSQIGEI
jgi:hypothetical protein